MEAGLLAGAAKHLGRARVTGSLPGASVAIVVPARDEEDRIAACIAALARQELQGGERPAVILVANNTTDSTPAVATDRARHFGLALLTVDCTIPKAEGVGLARAIGGAAALRWLPRLQALLTTDADCITRPDWLRRAVRHLREVDVVCGRIKPIEAEAAALPASVHERGQVEDDYLQLALEFEWLLANRLENASHHHGQCGGANLAFRASAYRASGGFRFRPSGEDREIVERMRALQKRIRHADDVVVFASCRLDGRAPDGMAAALAARAASGQYALDTALRPFHTMLIRHLEPAGERGPSRHGGRRLYANQAKQDLAALSDCVGLLRRLPTPADRISYLRQAFAPLLTQVIGLPQAEAQEV
jgi:hypothetical protein